MSYLADIGVTILIFVMLAASLNLLLGYAGQMSMAHAAFYGIGAFAAGRLALPLATGTEVVQSGLSTGLAWPQALAIGAAILVAFVSAFALSLPAARQAGSEYIILLTLAFQMIATQLMVNVEWMTGGQFGLYGLPSLSLFGWGASTPQGAFLVVFLITVVVVTTCWAIGESPFGRILKGIREDETAVRALGKNTWLAKASVFGISAAVAGGAGALVAFYHQFVSPSSFTVDTSILVISLIVVGGSGNMLGAIVGSALFIGITPALQNIPFFANNAIPWQGVIYGAALATVAIVRPEGMIPEGKSPFSIFRLLGDREVQRPGGAPAALARQRDNEALGGGRVGMAPASGLILRVEGLTKNFAGIRAVNNVSFELHRGAVTALIGPNGAGKTTIFNLIMAEVVPDSGRVFLHDQDVTGWPTYRIARYGMTRSFQDLRVFQRLTVLDNVALGVPDQFGERILALPAWPRVRKAERNTLDEALSCLSFVGIDHLAGRLVSSLSYAEQKLMSFAQLLATRADVLLLDEPTAGIDVTAVDRVIAVVRALRAKGAAVCIVEHSLHVVEELADDAVFLDQGTVLKRGTIAELTAQKELAKVYFGG